jgi:hypothetical protein
MIGNNNSSLGGGTNVHQRYNKGSALTTVTGTSTSPGSVDKNNNNNSNIQENNPLKTDSELKELLVQLEDINSSSKFRNWKVSFLRRYDTFIEQKGIEAAQKAYDDFSTNLQLFHSKCCKLEQAVTSGALTSTSSSVKGRNALNECHKHSVDVTERLLALLPSTGAEEKKCGYNKFQLGAILIRDNFMAYDTMISSQAILEKYRDVPLTQIADRQIIDQIDYYSKKIQNFCDIMASLALYDVMMKCIKYGRNGLNDLIIFVDAKTGYIGELSRSALVNAGLLTITRSDTGKESIAEAVWGDDKQSMITILKDKLSL